MWSDIRPCLVSITTIYGIWKYFIYAKMMNEARQTGNKLLFGPIISHQKFFEIVNYMGLTFRGINLCYFILSPHTFQANGQAAARSGVSELMLNRNDVSIFTIISRLSHRWNGKGMVYRGRDKGHFNNCCLRNRIILVNVWGFRPDSGMTKS